MKNISVSWLKTHHTKLIGTNRGQNIQYRDYMNLSQLTSAEISCWIWLISMIFFTWNKKFHSVVWVIRHITKKPFMFFLQNICNEILACANCYSYSTPNLSPINENVWLQNGVAYSTCKIYTLLMLYSCRVGLTLKAVIRIVCSTVRLHSTLN